MIAQELLAALATSASVGGIAGGYYAWRALDDRTVRVSQEQFRRTRVEIRERQAALADLAAEVHLSARPDLRRIGPTSMLTEDSLMLPAPLPLSEVRVVWDPSEPPDYQRLLRRAQRVLPKRDRWRRFATYSDALGTLMKPKLFENRPSFRVVEADWRSPDGPRLVFGHGQYFDRIDQGEALLHELAQASHGVSGRLPAPRRIPLRSAISADPFGFGKRVVLTSIGTLTIRRTTAGEGTFFLLYRGAGQVAASEGIYGPIPAGMFQPASMSPLGHLNDLSLWRNIMRETNEELLGAPDAIGDSGTEFDYTGHPYSDFEEALADGRLRVWGLGMGFEAHNLAFTIFTAAVYEADLFDELFSTIVPTNDEGTVITGPRDSGITGLPLRDPEVAELLRSPKVAPPTGALLHLAMRHRELLLADPT